jgi:hypothetical protein
VYRDVVMADLETAEGRLDDAYAANEKEKNARYNTHSSSVYTCA